MTPAFVAAMLSVGDCERLPLGCFRLDAFASPKSAPQFAIGCDLDMAASGHDE